MGGTGKKPIGRPRGTGTRRVYDRVRDKILRLELAPGADLDEAGLEEEFAISRTPVREALIRLASEGLVTLMPNRGARVTPLELTDVPQLLEALELHHRTVMRFAARRRSAADLAAMRQTHQAFAEAARAGDPDTMIDANLAFHMAIAGACGNRYLAQAFEALQTVSLRLARLSFAGGAPEYGNAEVVSDHTEMIAAIEAGDADAADALASKHMRIFRARVGALIDSSLAGDIALD